ncbi:MAG: hypothetical protein ND866_17595 [Pyrinomonadaceae bacterium]|nr:hypothetical protein [Pyrinomonadaceae bacterium]
MFEQRNRKLFVMGRVFWSIVLCCALTSAAFAHDDEETPSLQGNWRVTVNPGTPQQFFSLMQFNQGGTMTEANSTPGKSMSSGVWKKIRGHRNFAATFEIFQDGDSDGSFDSRIRVRLTIHLLDDDTIAGTSTIDVLTLDGTTQLAGPFPGIPLEGTRMRAMRE